MSPALGSIHSAETRIAPRAGMSFAHQKEVSAMRLVHRLFAVAALTAVFASAASAQNYVATLSGLSENPPNASPASGSASFFLDAGKILHCTISYTGLVASRTASHVHCCALPNANGPVLFATSGAGATSDAFAINVGPLTPAQEANLNAGLMYQNVHSTTFPGGEIRGQIFTAVGVESATWSRVRSLYQ